MKCLNCGETLVQIPQKRAKQFCDSTCRSNYWQKAKRKVAANNKPENKKRIEAERKNEHNVGKKHQQPQDEKKMQIVADMEAEFELLLKSKKNGKENT